MKRILVIGLLAGIAAGTLYYFNRQQIPTTGNPHLQRVPTDTLLFAGGQRPIPVRNLLEQPGVNSGVWMQRKEIEGVYRELTREDSADGVRLVLGLLLYYLNGADDPPQLLADLGLADEFHVTVYTVGLTPVLRIQAANPARFLETFASIEEEVGIRASDRVLDGYAYKAYPMVKRAGYPLLVVASSDEDLVFAIDVGDSRVLPSVLGLTKPESSLAESGYLEEINGKYHYSDFGTFFVNHEAIAAALTSEKNEAGRALDRLLGSDPDVDQRRTLRTPICERELRSIVKNWPRTVAGYRKLEFSEGSSLAEFHSILEFRNRELVKTLQKLRGHIPVSLQRSNEALFSLAIGVDVSKVGEVAGDLSQYVKLWDFKCPALSPLNELGNNAVSASWSVSLGAALAHSVRGLSLGVLGLETQGMGSTARLNHVDAVLALSAEEPASLLRDLAGLSGLGAIPVPEHGKAVDLPIPIPLPELRANVPLKLAISGDHIAVFSGEKADRLVGSMAGEDIGPNGLLYYQIDYQSYVDALMSAYRSARGTEPHARNGRMLEALRSLKAVYRGYIDITQDGVEFSGSVKTRK